MNVRVAMAAGIQCSFYQMFFHGCTWRIVIIVEQQQPLGQVAIVESFRLQKVLHHRFILALGDKLSRFYTFVLLAYLCEFFVKSKFLEVAEELFFEICRWNRIVGMQKRIEIFEHTAGCTRSRYKLYDAMVALFVLVPQLYVMLFHYFVQQNNTILNTGCRLDWKKWEAVFNVFQLLIDLFFCNTFLRNLLKILLCHIEFFIN